MLSSGDTLAYHKPNQVIEFLDSIHISDALSSSRPDLEQLCLKMGWSGNPELLKSIYRIFPRLRALELQGIRCFNRTEDPESDMVSPFLLELSDTNAKNPFTQDGIVAVIEKFQYLHTLKLAVELQEDSYQEDLSRAREIGSVDEAMQHWATVFGERLKSLQRLAFEKRRHTGKGYGQRASRGTPLWVWFLPNKAEVGTGLIMRRSEEFFDWNLAQVIPPTS